MKVVFLVAFLFLTTHGFAQVSQSSRVVSEKTLSVTGFEKDDRSFIEFFKKNPVWSQTTKYAHITIEFLGFEKENNAAKPFQFGKRPPQIPNPIKGSVFIKSDGYNAAVKMYFNNSGTVSWTIGTSNEEVTGTYNYNLEQGHVVPMLIHKCYLAKINNTDFEVWGSGVAHREFIYSEDLSNIIDILIDKYDGTDSIIVENKFRSLLRDVLTSYNPSKMVVDERNELKKMKN